MPVNATVDDVVDEAAIALPAPPKLSAAAFLNNWNPVMTKEGSDVVEIVSAVKFSLAPSVVNEKPNTTLPVVLFVKGLAATPLVAEPIVVVDEIAIEAVAVEDGIFKSGVIAMVNQNNGTAL